MYVCICKAVSDHTVNKAISSGASTVDDVTAATGAGTDCGGCRRKIERELMRAREGGGGSKGAACEGKTG